MTSRICKFGCETVLEGWDDNAKKYIEAGTGGLHTRERCEEAKAKLAQKPVIHEKKIQDKDDHGNETMQGFPIATKTEYIDHTQVKQPRLKAKTFTDPTPEGLDLQVNRFGDSHKIHAGQYQMGGSQYSTQVWYEEEVEK